MRAEERNKLIAEFMGARCECYVLSGTPCYAIRYPYIDHVGKSRARVYQTEEAAWQEFCRSAGYSHSWDWLMPVLERIQGLGYSLSLTADGTGGCSVLTGAGQTYLQSGETLLAAAYSTATSFIGQYRKKQQEKAA